MVDYLKAISSLVWPPMDPDTIHKPDPTLMHLAAMFSDILKKYYREELYGMKNMPKGKALIVGNHNSGITFMEPFVFTAEWHRRTKGKDPLYYLGHDAMVKMPIMGNLLQKLGVIRASHETATKAFQMGRKVVVFPGGNYEAFRPFTQRHQVNFGRKTGYLKLAIRNRVPIVPLMSLGGQETFFVLHRGEKLAKLTGVKKYLRSESFPITLSLPWGLSVGPIFHFPLPSKAIVEVGKPISLEKYRPDDADDPELLGNLSIKVQQTIQRMMDRHVKKRKLPVLG